MPMLFDRACDAPNRSRITECLSPSVKPDEETRNAKEDPNWKTNVPAAMNKQLVKIQHIRDEEKFKRLRDEWKSRKSHSSCVEEVILHTAYLHIIGMGPKAIPFILAELEKEIDHWFPALHAITEARPVPERYHGNMKQMAAAWLKWARKQGYRW